MSVCYQIICEETQEEVWIGQNAKLYKDEKTLELLEAFLYNNRDKLLVYKDDLSWSNSDTPKVCYTGLVHDWEIFCGGESLGVHKGTLLEAMRAAIEEKSPGATLFGPTQVSSIGALTYKPIMQERWTRVSSYKQQYEVSDRGASGQG